jgi:hypothetical protein
MWEIPHSFTEMAAVRILNPVFVKEFGMTCHYIWSGGRKKLAHQVMECIEINHDKISPPFEANLYAQISNFIS